MNDLALTLQLFFSPRLQTASYFEFVLCGKHKYIDQVVLRFPLRRTLFVFHVI